MELINKTHKDAILRKDSRTATIKFVIPRITFSLGCQEKCGLIVGKYVHFVRVDKVWLFFVSDDDNGYRINDLRYRRSYIVAIQSRVVCDMFLKDTGRKKGDKFYVQSSNHEFQGHALFEILSHKPITQIGTSK